MNAWEKAGAAFILLACLFGMWLALHPVGDGDDETWWRR